MKRSPTPKPIAAVLLKAGTVLDLGATAMPKRPPASHKSPPPAKSVQRAWARVGKHLSGHHRKPEL
jgi:hypothetical protein